MKTYRSYVCHRPVSQRGLGAMGPKSIYVIHWWTKMSAFKKRVKRVKKNSRRASAQSFCTFINLKVFVSSVGGGAAMSVGGAARLKFNTTCSLEDYSSFFGWMALIDQSTHSLCDWTNTSTAINTIFNTIFFKLLWHKLTAS